ncbi:MAG: DUF736 family protein [Alphaproteobacteria bacterium]|nr:DUF736 family protein [Alphaproteobacteria bacterium]
MHIGDFILSKEGNWIGTIRTLSLKAKLRLVPNDDGGPKNAPAYRVLRGNFRIGDAWEAQTPGNSPKPYLRLRLDDPCLKEPLSAALFPSDNGDKAKLVWNRRRESRRS